MLTADLLEALRPPAEGLLVLLAVGNPLRGDDGAGPYLAEKISKAALPEWLCVIDAGEHPEGAVGKIIEQKPAKVVILDAADFGGAPGEARLITQEAILASTLSTHRFPLPVIAELIRRDLGIPVHFIGIQPKTAGLGSPLSPEVRQAAEKILHVLKSQGVKF